MLKRLIYIIGLLMSLLAAEGLNRIGSLVAAFKGADSSFYRMFLIVAIISAGVFFLALFIKISKIIKWLMFMALLISTGLMLNAPAFPVNQQIIVGLFLSALASLTIATNSQPKKNQTTASVQAEEKIVK